jgi:hypothetical protein
VFSCARASPRSARCTEVHETQVSFGEGRVIVRGPCSPSQRRIVLQVTANLVSSLPNVQLHPLTFRLSGPC